METLGTIGWLAVAALVIAGLAFITTAYLLHEVRAWRREDEVWKEHFGNRFLAIEKRILGDTLPETPHLLPAFTGRETGDPRYGSPPGAAPEIGERTTWAPPILKR